MGYELTSSIGEMLKEGNSFIHNMLGQVDLADLNDKLKSIPVNIRRV